MFRHPLIWILSIQFCWNAPLLSTSDDEVLSLPPYKVSANRFAQYQFDVPANISVLDKADIIQFNATNLTDILQRGLGLELKSATGNPGNADISMRGFTNGNQRVLVLVDGHRINRPDMGTINWLQIPVGAVESIEVLRGPWTTLYGNNAVGGVIKITTRRVREGWSGEADGYLGEYGLRGTRINGATGTASIAASVGVDISKADGWRNNAAWAADSVYASLSAPQTEEAAFDWAVSFYGTDTFYEIPGPLWKTLYLDNPQQAIDGLDGTVEEAIRTFNGHLGWTLENEHTLTLGTGLHLRELDWELGGSEAVNDIQAINLSPSYTWQFAETKGVLGVDLNSEQLDFTETVTLSEAEVEREAVGLYGFAEHPLSEKTKLSFGLRWETSHLMADYRPSAISLATPFYGEKTNDGLATNLGLLFRPSERFRWWLRADRLFRIPAVDEVAAYQGYELPVPFNFDLVPEKGWNLELGTGYNYKALSADITLFANRMEGEIDFNRVTWLNTNLPKTERTGVEARGEWKNETLTIYGSGRWIMTKNHVGGNMPLIPSLYLTLGLDWTPIHELRIGWSMLYQTRATAGEDFTNSRVRIPPYALHEFHINWQLRPYWDIYLQVDNLFDKHYASLKYQELWYPGNGRMAKIGTRIHF